MSSQPSTSTSTQFHRPPSVTGFQETLAMIPLPPNLSAISGACERWPSAILAMLAHGFHEDGKHLQFDEDGFYTSTTDHYRTGTSKYQKVSSDDKMQNWCVCTTHVEMIMARIFDLCAVLDRLTGGSTIFMHHPGATPPGTPIVPESLNANVYINPKVLVEHHELHPVVAEITQLFLSKYAAPLAQSFTLSCTNKGWRVGSSQMQMRTPTKGKGRAETSLLPLVSPPITPSSSHFVLPGRPDGSLEVLLSSNSRILSYVPRYDGRITWVASQIDVRSTQNRTGDSAVKAHTNVTGYVAPIMPMKNSKKQCSARETNKGTHVTVVESSSNSDTHLSSPWSYPSSDQKGKGVRKIPSTAPATNMSTPAPSNCTIHRASLALASNNSVIVPFGSRTITILENLGYPDTFHRVCYEICDKHLTKRWVVKLQEEARISEEDADAMLKDCQDCYAASCFPSHLFELQTVKMSKEVRQQLTERRRAKHLDEEQEIQAVLSYLNVKATELAAKFKQPHHRTGAWHAFMHFKGLKSNDGKDFNEKSNVADLVKHTAEYHDLTDEEKTKLVAEFDAIKKGASNRPPNITTRTRAAECSRSFQYVKEELEALKLRVGIEAMVFMAFFTSSAAEQFVRLYLRKDVAQLATDFESTILASGLLLNTSTNHRDRVSKAKTAIRMGLRTSLCSITNDLSATVEFTQYHNLVRRHQVKLVGWTHPQWANPSDLKGGIESLENLADAIATGTCHFVPISSEELEDRLRHMKNGEKLTPEVEPPMPIEPTRSSSPDTPQLPADTNLSLSTPSTAESLSANLVLMHSSDLDSTPPNSLPPASNSKRIIPSIT
ncbi:uncharacterized protein HD556DRAFT_1440268 [Suillus plorans]|uniref:Uncharacterized protein n=1 Tax=Suillus plorans TaxID=116603 RepID=A0A9P7DMJ5_9AGAM|nr:uncharacterized protein HD556DRAFT_1440268 [Suillus plorans]KAG1798563.1 hypothetical protein HD556DRAFT_1440268 [Suillus plorans]